MYLPQIFVSRSTAGRSSPWRSLASSAPSSSTRVESSAVTTPAGTASVDSAPRTAARRAAALLLDVRATNGGGRNGTADHAGDGDQRQHVRESLEQRAVVRPRFD